MGDALRGRRLLLVAAIMAAVLAGAGAAAQAGLLSRAESETGDGSGASRGAAAAIADPSGSGGDIVAVGETTATNEDGDFESSATILRVGDTKIGEAPMGVSNPLADALNGQSTEDIIDAGCDDDPEQTATGSCLTLLYTERFVDSDGEFEYSSDAYFSAAEGYTPLTGFFVVLASTADQNYCQGRAGGVVLAVENLPPYTDLSEADSDGCNITVPLD